MLLFFNAAETTFTLPLVKEEVDPMVFVENNDVDDAAPPKEDRTPKLVAPTRGGGVEKHHGVT